MSWRDVPVFISSTFNDMHAERDYLLKRVFPQLSEWCAERKLNLVDIDLRWGVTEEDATQNKRTIKVCLESIDRCRPFFLCFMGQRRGWVPQADEIDPDYGIYENLKKYIGKNSVTEMEIIHALIDPMHNRKFIDNQDGCNYNPVDYAFFYERDNEYLSDITFADTKKVYENSSDTPDWGSLNIPKDKEPLRYYASWNRAKNTPEIALPTRLYTIAEYGTNEWHRAHNDWARRWLDVGVIVNSDGTISGEMLEKAKQYNSSLTSGRLDNFSTANGRQLSDIIFEQMKEVIKKRFDLTEDIPEQSPLQQEVSQQEQFLHQSAINYQMMDGEYEKINDYLEDDDNNIFAVTGFMGSGKTSYLANWISSVYPNRKTNEHNYLIFRFVGGSENSSSEDGLIRSIAQEIKEEFSLWQDIPLESAKLFEIFPNLLEQAGRSKKIIVIVDALNQLQSGLLGLDWIPGKLPKNVKLIISIQSNPQGDAFLQKKNWIKYLVNSEGISKDLRKKIVQSYFKYYLKNLDEDIINSIIALDASSNPLFLHVVISEMRLFGSFANLRDVISHFGPDTESAFIALLERIENDTVNLNVSSSVLLSKFLSLIIYSRYGLSVEELVNVLCKENLFKNSGEAYDEIYVLLRQLQTYIARQENRITIRFEAFKKAIVTRYSQNNEKEWHAVLAEYFSTPQPNETAKNLLHRLNEQVWQYVFSDNMQSYIDLVWKYSYIKQRIELCGIVPFLDDLELGSKLTDITSEQLESLEYLSQAIIGASEAITENSKMLPFQLCGRLQNLREKIKKTDTLLDSLYKKQFFREPAVDYPWLRPCTPCLPNPGGIEGPAIASFSKSRSVCLQLCSDTIGSIIAFTTEKGFELINVHRQKTILKKEDATVTALSISANGEYCIVGYADGNISVIDVHNKVDVYRTFANNPVSVAVSNNGENCIILSCIDKDKNIGQLIFRNFVSDRRIEKDIVYSITEIQFLSDQNFVCFAEKDKFVIWNIETGEKYSEPDVANIKAFGIAQKQNKVYLLKDKCIVSCSPETKAMYEVPVEEDIALSYGWIGKNAFCVNDAGTFAVVRTEPPVVVDLETGAVTKRFLSSDNEFTASAMSNDGSVYFTVSYSNGYNNGKILSWYPKNNQNFDSSRLRIPFHSDLIPADYSVSSNGNASVVLRNNGEKLENQILSVFDFSKTEPESFNFLMNNITACAVKNNLIVLGTKKGGLFISTINAVKKISEVTMKVESENIQNPLSLLEGFEEKKEFLFLDELFNSRINRIIFVNDVCHAALENGKCGSFSPEKILKGAPNRIGITTFTNRKNGLFNLFSKPDEVSLPLTDIAAIRYEEALLGVFDGQHIKVVRAGKKGNDILFDYTFPKENSSLETYFRICGKNLDSSEILFSNGNHTYSISYIFDYKTMNIKKLGIIGGYVFKLNVRDRKTESLFYNKTGRYITSDLRFITGIAMMNGDLPYSVVKEKNLPTYRYAVVFDNTGNEIWQIPLQYGYTPSHCIISEDGKYVLVVNRDNLISLWDFKTKELITELQWTDSIDLIDFQPFSNYITLIDAKNNIVILSIEGIKES